MAEEEDDSKVSEIPDEVPDVIKVPLMDDDEDDVLLPVGAYVTNPGRPRGDPAIYRWGPRLTDYFIAYWPPYGDGEVVGVSTKTQCQQRPEVGRYHHWTWVRTRENAEYVSLPRFEDWCDRCDHPATVPERCRSNCCAKHWRLDEEARLQQAIRASMEGDQGDDDEEVEKELFELEGFESEGSAAELLEVGKPVGPPGPDGGE
jgi:hypothetical protein